MKKIIIFIIVLEAIFTIFASNSNASLSENEVENFYYSKTIETISKYIDENHTSLGFMYEYNDFLNEKLSFEKNLDNIYIINELIEINKENIKKQANKMNTDEDNIQKFVVYFEQKNKEYLKFTDLITKNGNINSIDENGDNMFAIILKNGTYEDIDFALSRGLKSTIINKTGNIAFYDFIKTGGKFYPEGYLDKFLAGQFDEEGTIDIIKNIIKKGFNLNLVDLNNQNISFYAIDLGNQKIIDLIFNDKNNNLNIKNKDGLNPIFYAISTNKPISILSKLLQNQNFDINATDSNGDNLIQYTSGKDIALLTEVLKRNIEINNINKLGETEITKLMKSESDSKNFLKKFDLLKEYKKFDLSIKDKNGNDALLIGVSLTGGLDIFKALIPEYNNMETKNNSGSTLLHIAIEKGNISLVEELLKYNINTNFIDNEGNSCINIAAKNNYIDIINLLLLYKADINNVNNAGENLLYTAVKDNNDSLIKLALQNKADPNIIVGEDKISIFLYAVKNNKYEIVTKLLTNSDNIGLNINQVDDLGQNALFYAMDNKNPELVKILLENGINVNKSNINGISPIIYATLKSDYNSFLYLLKYQADYNISDKTGKNALITACEQDNINIIKKLVDLGVNVYQKDRSGKKCIDYIKNDSKIGLELYNKLK